MNKSHRTIISNHSTARGTLRSYTIGLVLSIVLTVVSYILAVNDLFNGVTLMLLLALFAIIQLAVQLQFFIHLDHESSPHWNKLIFLFMILIVSIVVVGSIWIMNNLNYNMMHQAPVQNIQEQKGGF